MQFSRSEICEGISLSSQEWQILEFIIEHRAGTANMITISECLGIAQSSFYKSVKHLCEVGLVERFQAKNNKKNVILLPTAEAEAHYVNYAKVLEEHIFNEFFRELDTLDNEEIMKFTVALTRLNDCLDPKGRLSETDLVKKD